MKAHSNERIAYLAAVSILFSAAELFIPKPLPFFRLGLANIPILLSLSMPIWDFLVLLIMKAFASSYISGNLFSPFLLLSLSQTIASGLMMRALSKLGENRISRYGISAGGAAVSAIIQLIVASLYLGRAVLSYTPLMLTASLASSVLVAFISYRIDLSEAPEMNNGNHQEARTEKHTIIMLSISSAAAFSSKDIYSALAIFALALMLQHIAHRKILITPYISIIAFMLLTSLFAPEGRILFEIGPLRAGTVSLIGALIKALHISAAVALSQSYTSILHFRGGILALTMEYSAALIDAFNSESGSLSKRLNKTLSLKKLSAPEREQRAISSYWIYFSTISFTIISCASLIIKR